MTIERGDTVRGKMLIYLAVLCAMLLGAGWLLQQEKALEQERSILETEIMLLEYENAQLQERITELQGRITELKEQQTELGRRMEKWLDTWEVKEVEVTGYAPLDPRAILGVCYSGDPGVTSSGAKTTPGITAAAQLDICVETQEEALNEIGRRKILAVIER